MCVGVRGMWIVPSAQPMPSAARMSRCLLQRIERIGAAAGSSVRVDGCHMGGQSCSRISAVKKPGS
jgi:hypothetical protein